MTSASPNRVPIQHPDYRYPESRNPYYRKIRELPERLVFGDQDTECHVGEWRSQFLDATEKTANAKAETSGRRALHVEIGCNGGHVSLEWAARNPADLYIGLDWKMKQIHRGGEKAQNRKLRNLIFLRAHAERLKYVFAPGEVDFLYLYFPDPWPKKSQRKNRFINPGNLDMLAGIVRPGGVFHIKTDHPGYFEWMEESLKAASPFWSILERSADLHQGHPSPTDLTIPEVTLFERIFIREGLPIHSLKLLRRE